MWFRGQLDSGLLCLRVFYNGAGVLYGSSFINVPFELKGLPLFDSEKRGVRNVRSQSCRRLWARRKGELSASCEQNPSVGF